MEDRSSCSDQQEPIQNPSDGGERPPPTAEPGKPKVVVIMGPTGSGKSKLAIDLATHFPVEVINADSMQVYRGLDVLTNKVPLHEQKGVPHHLLGTVSPVVEFTAKDFRDSAIPLIDEILARNHLPVIVGGTNYYIQALVSSFLLDDTAQDMEDCISDCFPRNDQTVDVRGGGRDMFDFSYEFLKNIDPVAANRLHPNNHRKITQYLKLYARTGILPSKLYQGKAAEVWQNWGDISNCRFNCCFICVDAAMPVLDQFVEKRVDCMIYAGLLGEVYDIYKMNADCTRGLRQAIGVREFDEFLKVYQSASSDDSACDLIGGFNNDKKMLKDNISEILHFSCDNQSKILLAEAIDEVKANTRRLVRSQKRRLARLETLFGWNIRHVDATESISCKSDESWGAQVVAPAVEIIRAFLSEDRDSVLYQEAQIGVRTDLVERNLWTQYTCKACGDKVLRGAHEWEQHKQGRGHRKRMASIRKAERQCDVMAHRGRGSSAS
ncbi:tRNA dimethylallyltransferase 2 [Turnera subulata]|uniref:tRNA dimethylallyltransferase 2 n=1 Tax=Turnera subulata TaxID=218843 RepID=A0A9Q0J938_9ROSI|nr:tRNA dimethylallyltransferase 2 [Turnera subulata]